VEEEHINSLVLKQLSFWFGLPVCVAVIAAVAFVWYFFNAISAQISAYVGVEALTLQISYISVIILILFVCYFVITRMLFLLTIQKEG
jgi:putative ABC transport system permease protein